MAELEHSLDGPAEAPVLVLSNSLGTTFEMWDRQLPAFVERFRVLRYNMRGHGRSPVPPGPYAMADLAGDVVELLDRLEIGRVIFCGISIGGMVGLRLALDAPDRVERLVLSSTAAQVLSEQEWAERAATVREQGVVALADATIERWFSPEFRETEPEVVDDIRATLVATPAEGYAGCCEAVGAHDVRDRLGEIEAPTLVVAAEDDPAVTPDHGELIAERVPRARLEMLGEGRHLCNIERPEEFNQIVLGELT